MNTYNYVYINIFILAVKIDKLSEHKCLDYLLHTENHGYCLIGKLIWKLVFKWKYVGYISKSRYRKALLKHLRIYFALDVVILKCHDFTILKESADGMESLILFQSGTCKILINQIKMCTV